MKMDDQYINRIRECVKSGDIIYIYGAGKVAGIIYDVCKKNEIKIDGFCVTELDGNVNILRGVPVVQFNTLSDKRIVFLIGAIERGEKKISKIISQKNYRFIELPSDILMANEEEKKRFERPTLEITPQIGCSVNCKYCPQGTLLHTYFKYDKNRKKTMSLNEFKQCLNKCPQDTLIEFAGFVEPFLNPQSIDMMLYANDNGFDITLFTTLVGLNREGVEQILKIPFKEVVLHTADRDGLANIPVTKEYCYLLKKIVDARKADGRMFVDGANCQSKPHPRVLEIVEDRLKIYCEMSDRAGNLDNSDGNLATAFIEGPIYCSRSKNLDHNVLLPDGTVVLCCSDFGMQHVLGNLIEDEYVELKSGTEMQRIKEKMHNGRTEELLCRNCVYALPKRK